MSARWHVYMVRCSDRTLYTGIATNVQARIKVHNQGKGAKYTRARLPVCFVWSEGGHDASSSRVREAAIKKLTRVQKEALIKKAEREAR